jgi:PTS system nitrogen regulatory IIA component
MLLKPEAFRVLSSASSKKRLLHEIANIGESAYGLDHDNVVEALLERESLGPTGVGNGVALPHARVDGLEEVVGALLLLEKPVEFEAVDRQPVDLAFGLFAPREAGVEHLKALALVSRTLRDPGVCAKLRANDDPATLHMIVTEAQAAQAA